jgi:hypothetical protein
VENCVARNPWSGVALALSQALPSLLIDADANATIKLDYGGRDLEYNPAIQAINSKFNSSSVLGHPIHIELLGLFGGPRTGDLVVSDGSSSLFPASLLQLQRGLGQGIRYGLRDGQTLVNGRYYHRLKSTDWQRRPQSCNPLSDLSGNMTPSSLGEHSNMIFNIGESMNCAEVRTTVIFMPRPELESRFGR